MEAQDKIKKSAEALGVLLQVPAFVDPNYGFHAEKEVKWENGDKIKVSVNWADGAFNYEAYLGQIDPKTNELSFISGAIAEAPSLEALVEKIDEFLSAADEERKELMPAEIPTEDDLVAAYNDANQEYQEMLLDPCHDRAQVWEMSNKLKEIEVHLRENGIRPGDLLV